MPELLLELFSEEIPARMQRQAAEDLRRLVTDGLVAGGLTYEGAKAFATPRRLALTVHGVTSRSADIREERKGPRVGAPPQALEGFLRAAGLASIEDAQVQSDPKKGDFYVAVIRKPGRPAEDIIAEVLPRTVRDFPWPKSMRWGAQSAPPGTQFSGPDAEGSASLRWVRPLRSILCTFGPETEDPIVVPVEVAGVAAGNVTYGHRFLGRGKPIKVRRFDDYVPALERAKVVLDADRRKAIIETEAGDLAFAQGLELVADAALLEEVAGLVEWPVVLMGRFDETFLDIPEEVIRLTIRANQKCFVVRDPSRGPAPYLSSAGRSSAAEGGDGAGVGAPLANRFLLTANIEASDGGKAIVAGNERVIAARLADARFYWEQDKATSLETWAERLASVTFHEKLGSQAERVERIARLAGELAPLVGADPDDAERAARLAKADLVTGMVGEFPELQGVMGRYYFMAQHGLLPGASPSDLSSRFGRQAETGTYPLDQDGTGSRISAGALSGMTKGEGSDEQRLSSIADAIRDHYKPQGPNDAVPSEPVSVAVALADKLDTLVGFWAIDEKPTGSKDPYALRRAALGVIRIVLANGLRLRVVLITAHSISLLFRQTFDWQARRMTESLASIPHTDGTAVSIRAVAESISDEYRGRKPNEKELAYVGLAASSLLAFFADRLKIHLRETGARHDLIDAVFSSGNAGASSSPGTGEADSARGRAGEGRRISSPASRPSPGSELRSDSASPLRGEEQRRAAPANDDLLLIVRRVEALGKFLDTDDGANLLVGYRRAANILRAEEKKDGAGAFEGEPDAGLIAERGLPEEQALYDVMQSAERSAREAVAREDFESAMRALAELRPAVDAFFDKVTVNADDPALRANRLKLLNQLRRATLAVADFSRIGG